MMHHHHCGLLQRSTRLFFCLSLLWLVSACGSAPQPVSPLPPFHAQTPSQNPAPTATPTPVSTPTGGATSPASAGAPSPSTTATTGHPVLAFYYPWYTAASWCSCTMSDLPTIQYSSSDVSTIARQLTWAAAAGITGFISSWWGPGDVTDQNFAKLLAQAGTLEAATGSHFASTIYFESDAPALGGADQVASALRYIIAHYSADPHFFHWRGKPVLFFWDPLGQGRTLAFWETIRSQVDPTHAMIWSAEGTNTGLLTVFDGLHLFSAAYWGIDQGI